jgi:hypothetical protein
MKLRSLWPTMTSVQIPLYNGRQVILHRGHVTQLTPSLVYIEVVRYSSLVNLPLNKSEH